MTWSLRTRPADHREPLDGATDRHRGECGVADDLTSLLASGERAAFHGRPGAGVDPLERAAAMATEHNLPTESSAARWLLAVCQARRGGSARRWTPWTGCCPSRSKLPPNGGSSVPSARRRWPASIASSGATPRRGLTTRSLWR